MDDSALSPAEALKRALEERDEELRSWRLRCLQAETEVRALKRGGRHKGPAPPQLGGGGEDAAARAPDERPGNAAPTPEDVLSSHAAAEATARRPEVHAGGSADVAVREARLREELRCMQKEHTALLGLARTESASRAGSGQEELATCSEPLRQLQHQVQEKNSTIVQLQAMMVQERQQVERQFKAAESQTVFCQEELREMTQRAESLSEQVVKSKKKAGELQAAREDASRLHGSLEACEARLAEEVASHEALQAASKDTIFVAAGVASDHELAELREAEAAHIVAAVPLQAEGLLPEASLSTATGLDFVEAATAEERPGEQDVAGALDEASAVVAVAADSVTIGEEGAPAKAPSGPIQQKVLQCVGCIRQLHTELRSELRSMRPPPGPVTPRVVLRARGNGAATSAAAVAPGLGDRLLPRIAKQLDRMEHLVASGHAAMPAPQGVAVPPAPWEAPPPHTANVPQVLLGADAEALLEQRINEQRLAAEEAHEALLRQYGEELDDLVRRHAQERQELHNEVEELRAECSGAEAAAAGGAVGSRQLAEVQSNFEGQVVTVKRDFIAQIVDLQERQREQRGQEEREVLRLRRGADASRRELLSAQREFATLARLYEREAREHHSLKETYKRLEVSEEDQLQEGAEASSARTPPRRSTSPLSLGERDATPSAREVLAELRREATSAEGGAFGAILPEVAPAGYVPAMAPTAPATPATAVASLSASPKAATAKASASTTTPTASPPPAVTPSAIGQSSDLVAALKAIAQVAQRAEGGGDDARASPRQGKLPSASSSAVSCTTRGLGVAPVLSATAASKLRLLGAVAAHSTAGRALSPVAGTSVKPS